MKINELLKILSNVNQLKIIAHLYACTCHKFNVTKIQTKLQLSQSLLSKMMTNLRKHKIVEYEQRHKEKYYALNHDFKTKWAMVLEPIMNFQEIKRCQCQCNN